MNLKSGYWHMLGICRQRAMRVNEWLKPFYCPLQQRSNHGYYAVDIHARVGLFAQLNWCLSIFAHCELYELKPYVRLTSPFYTQNKADNWLDYLFIPVNHSGLDPDCSKDGRLRISCVTSLEQLGLPRDYEADMTLESAHELLKRHLRLCPEVQEYVDHYVTSRFDGRKVLGIHYRGTDKGSEAEPVTYEHCIDSIHRFLQSHGEIDALFVASDEQAFVERVVREITAVEVIFHEDQERSRDGRAVHTRRAVGSNQVKAWEAMVNCLLLSRCDALLRTASFLSGWSSVFNPQLPVILLNRHHEAKCWFPDREVVKRSLTNTCNRRIKASRPAV